MSSMDFSFPVSSENDFMGQGPGQPRSISQLICRDRAKIGAKRPDSGPVALEKLDV